MSAWDQDSNTVGDVHGDVAQIGDVHGDVHIGRTPARRWPRVIVGAVSALIVVAAATIVWRTLDRPDPPVTADSEPRLAIATSVENPCGYLVLEDGGQRGYADGAAVTLTGQNSSSAEGVDTGGRVEHRTAHTTQVHAEPDRAAACPGDPLPTRNFEVDFTGAAPQVRPNARRLRPGDAPETTTFPYRIRRGEPETFRIGLSSKDRDCRFALVVDWIANGEQHSTTTPDFRVVPR
jgi:hypothetical protein